MCFKLVSDSSAVAEGRRIGQIVIAMIQFWKAQNQYSFAQLKKLFLDLITDNDECYRIGVVFLWSFVTQH